MSALKGVQNYRTRWIGWPGVYVEEGPDRDNLTAKLDKQGFIPVWLDEDIVSQGHVCFC